MLNYLKNNTKHIIFHYFFCSNGKKTLLYLIVDTHLQIKMRFENNLDLTNTTPPLIKPSIITKTQIVSTILESMHETLSVVVTCKDGNIDYYLIHCNDCYLVDH